MTVFVIFVSDVMYLLLTVQRLLQFCYETKIGTYYFLKNIFIYCLPIDGLLK